MSESATSDLEYCVSDVFSGTGIAKMREDKGRPAYR